MLRIFSSNSKSGVSSKNRNKMLVASIEIPIDDKTKIINFFAKLKEEDLCFVNFSWYVITIGEYDI